MSIFKQIGIDRALIVKKKWLDLIFSGEKVWEIRGHDTSVRGRIGLIESGSGLVCGECELIDSYQIVFERQKNLIRLHGIVDWDNTVKYKRPHGWVIKNAKEYDKPIPYTHPQGAVVWVRLDRQQLS